MKTITLMLLAFSCATAASAQVVTTSQPLARTTLTCDGTGCESPVTVLSRHLTRGDMPRLQGYAAELLRTLARTGPSDVKTALGDVNRNYYRVVWICREEGGGTSLQSVVVHAGATEAIRTLPGVTSSSRTQLLDVFVSADAGAVLDSQYASTPVKDPLTAQIASFVDKTGVIGFLAGLPLARGEAARGGRPTVATSYSVARPILPLARADLRIRDTVVVPGSASGLRDASARLKERLSTRDIRLSSCGQALAAADAAAIAKGLTEGDCVVPQDQPDGLTTPQVNSCRASLSDMLEDAYKQSATCRDAAPAPGADPVLLVDKQFNDLVSSMRETRRTAEFKLANTPRTRYTFGILSSAIIGSPHYGKSTVRAKIGSNGSIVQDPMPTVLTMALINIHPHPYDPQADGTTWAERFRFFAGTSITPDFGVGGGAGVMIVRGLTANVGWANLFVKTPRSGLAVGQTPPVGKTPLTAGNASVWFAGLSYSFK